MPSASRRSATNSVSKKRRSMSMRQAPNNPFANLRMRIQRGRNQNLRAYNPPKTSANRHARTTRLIQKRKERNLVQLTRFARQVRNSRLPPIPNP